MLIVPTISQGLLQRLATTSAELGRVSGRDRKGVKIQPQWVVHPFILHFFPFHEKWGVQGVKRGRLGKVKEKKESGVAQSCLTLCDPMDCGPPGSSVHGIFQARILDWVAISFSRGSSQPRDQTQVSHIAGRRFTI